MNENLYITLHNDAAKLALEAARKTTVGREADCFTENYQKVIEHLISEYKKHDVEP